MFGATGVFGPEVLSWCWSCCGAMAEAEGYEADVDVLFITFAE
jgi:hypothetical protein